ncbi:MAG: hypothetical protein ABIO70_04710 [Pseudomonadota bacterium]
MPEAGIQPLAAGAAPADHDEASFTLLDLSDCEHELGPVSPAMVRKALIEGERLDPRVADQLGGDFPFLTPALMVFGERGRLLAAAPTLRRVRRASLYSGDTHAALLGMVYGLPRVVLAEFQNGPVHHAAVDELAELFESWDGRLLVILVAGIPPEASPIGEGDVIAAHEVDLERPVLWHRGERWRP